MLPRMLLTVVVSITMVNARPSQTGYREARWGGDWDKKYEEPEFTVEKVEENYEKRVYPPSIWACTNLTVDTAMDPLAGLEDWDFTEIMQSQRYKTRVPASLMFWPLFRYISGNNAGKNISIFF